MSRIGLGHQNQIVAMPDGSGTKALRLKNGRYTRKLAPGDLSGWGEVWVGLRLYVQNTFLWSPGAIPSGGQGYGRNLKFSFGLSNGIAGSLPSRDVYGDQTYWIGRRTSGGAFNLLRPSPYTSGDYLQLGFTPQSVKNGTVATSTAFSAAFSLNRPFCWIQRFRTSGGNLYVSDVLTCPIGRDVSVYEMIDVLNTSSTWSTIATRANSRYSWTNTTEASSGLSVADEQATYGTLDSVDIGWWQNQMPLYLETVLVKIP